MDNLYLSVIVPVYNEEGAVAGLYQEILDVCQKINKRLKLFLLMMGLLIEL